MLTSRERGVANGLSSASLLTLALLAPAAQGSDAGAYPPISVSVEAERLGDTNVWYVPGEPAVPSQSNEGLTANAGFVVTDEGVVVLDALGTPSLGAEMIQAIRGITDKPITRVIVSHYHADHIYGLQAFKDLAGAEIVAHELADEYIGSQTAEGRLAQRREALAPWVNEHTRVVSPDVTFDDELVFESGDTRFTVLHAGPAHAPDDALMMVEPAGVLFSGDIVQDGRVPFLDSESVDTAQWLASIERVRSMQPRYVVPGHGGAYEGAISALDFTQGYISFVRDRMGQAVENWVAFADAYADTDWSEYEGLPAFEATHESNAYRVYLEMEQAALE